MSRAGSLGRRLIDGAEQIPGVDFFEVDKEKEFVVIAGTPDSIRQFFHRPLIIRGLEFQFPVRRLFHGGSDGMECGHVDTGAPQHSLLADIAFTEADILRSGRKNVHEKTLVFLVRAGEQAANGVNGLVLLFEKRAQVSFGAGLSKVVHWVRI